MPDRVLNTSDDRPVKILTVGAGVSGILMAYLAQRDCENVEHVIYEKNGDVLSPVSKRQFYVQADGPIDWRHVAGGTLLHRNGLAALGPLLMIICH